MAVSNSAQTSLARTVVLPALGRDVDLDIESLREPGEGLFLGLIVAFNAIVLSVCAAFAIAAPAAMLIVAAYVGSIALMVWVSTKLAWAFIEGHGVRVGPHQYPQIYEVVRQAATQFKLPMPTIIVLAGSGVIEMFVAKRFTRRGYIILTSNLMDALIESGTSRELMMLVGRQLGHIKAGHFKYWFFKDVIGAFTFLIHKAYWRRCHYTADRVGLMVAGDCYAAEQSLLLLTVGPKLAAHANVDEIERQAEEIQDRFWSRLNLWLSDYPYIVERIRRLRDFASGVQSLREPSGARPAIGALPIRHMRLRTLPVMMVHGHDHHALLEVQDFLRARYPYVEPVVMALETLGGASLPEKFERLAAQARGAIAILTPDDLAYSVRELHAPAARSRQNVVLEIGWFWGRLGRGRCLLLSHGRIEMPSDLSGVDCLEYVRSPREHFESVRDFIARLESLESGVPVHPSMTDGGNEDRFVPAAAAGPASDPVSRRRAPRPVSANPHQALACPVCDAANMADSRFCEDCGSPLAAARFG